MEHTPAFTVSPFALYDQLFPSNSIRATRSVGIYRSSNPRDKTPFTVGKVTGWIDINENRSGDTTGDLQHWMPTAKQVIAQVKDFKAIKLWLHKRHGGSYTLRDTTMPCVSVASSSMLNSQTRGNKWIQK